MPFSSLPSWSFALAQNLSQDSASSISRSPQWATAGRVVCPGPGVGRSQCTLEGGGLSRLKQPKHAWGGWLPGWRAAQQVSLLALEMLKPQNELADGWLTFLVHMLPQGSAARLEQLKHPDGGAGQFAPWAARQAWDHV